MGGFQDADYMAAFDLLLEPIIAEFDPDLIIVSAGYDAAEGVRALLACFAGCSWVLEASNGCKSMCCVLGCIAALD